MISAYHAIEELSHTDWYVLLRGQSVGSGEPVLLKELRRQARGGAAAGLLGREFELLQKFSIPGIIQAKELVLENDNPILILRDPGGCPLSRYLAAQPSRLESFFQLAAALCDILGELHRRDLFCGSLNPCSILVQPANRRVFLADLSLAAFESGEPPAHFSIHSLPGLLPYISPEQTGRTNRTTDYRTDFYSLGSIFYEWLTGVLPFASKDTLELIHGHIAKTPPPPAEVNPVIPLPISEIVMRLLAKTAEERYQSAQGIKADLERCQREWQLHTGIAPFSLGQRDVSDRFLIPQKLYGRDREVGRLLEVFDRVCEGRASMMLVAGYSGIGKTSLIQELYKPIVSQRGYFISGKFDQVGRNVPFGALIQAFRGLVQQLLTESEERLARWRMRLAEALGANGGVLAEVIPEIELIVGKQPEPPALGPTEALNRFQLVFQNFVGALARREHPLVVFLDDLQWADSATLSLFQPLLTTLDIQFLFLIGAYRDNEVDAGHPLARTLSALESAGAGLHHISLGPLELSDLRLFVRDTLRGSLSDAEPLARLVIEKTQGNPFFVIQFLKTLKQEGLLKFDYAEGRWIYQMEEIRRAGMTDNVIDLMTQKIQRLSTECRQTLTLAACIGNPFDLETLAVVNQQPAQKTAEGLAEALDEGLILPAALPYRNFSNPQPGFARPACYAFLHDRVQQAAYTLVPDQQKPLVHLTVGRLLLNRWDTATAEEKVFDLVHHLNLGSGLITDKAERLALIRLNLAAGRRAKASTAYQPALGYFKAGLRLVDEERWRSDYELTFALHLEAAECKYLCGLFDEANRDFDLLLKRARSRLDKAQVFMLKMLECENLSRYAAAVGCGLEGLALFGVSFPATPEQKQAVLEEELSFIQALLEGRSIEDLVSLPLMEDPEKRMVMKLLTIVWSSAYISGDQVLTRLISATMVRLSLEYGNTEESAYGYATHTITVGPLKGDYKSAYAWGELALSVNQRLNDRKGRAKIHQQFQAHANYWRRPFEMCVPHAREATRTGLEAGDFTYAGYGAMTECWHTLLITRHLDEFVRDCASSIALLEKLKLTGLVPAQKTIQNWACALQGRTASPTSFTGAGFDEESFLESYGSHPFRVIYLHVLKVHLCVLFEEFELAREAARRAREMAHHLLGTIWPVYLDFFEGLALAAVCQGAPDTEREPLLQELVRIYESLSRLERNCPENFRCAALLLAAGLETSRGRIAGAIEAYEQAIEYARETQNLHHQALACELYGRFWIQRGNPEVASLYFAKARRRYADWGAVAKVGHLTGKMEQLRRRPGVGETSPAVAFDSTPAASVEASAATAVVPLDIVTVTKAARALAVEIELEELLRKLMEIALENAGAQRGCFLQEEDGRWVVAAEGNVAGPQKMKVLSGMPLESCQSLSKAVVHYVHKTGQSVVVGDAATDDRFLSDPYIGTAHPRSILCVPVIHQGKRAGILYLENNLAANVFTTDRIEVMHILSSQAAVSLENARLYAEMKQEAELRRKAEELLRAIVEGTASVTGSDFFFSLVRHLASALGVRYAFVTECRDRLANRTRTLAFWKGDGFAENFEYDLQGTPCMKALDGEVCHYSDRLVERFPQDTGLVDLQAESYVGIPIVEASGRVIGHLAVMDDKPMPESALSLPLLQVFAARAGAEMERLRAEEGLRTALAEVEMLKNRLHAENVYLQEEIRREHNFEELVGSSPALLNVLRLVEQVAPTDSTVVIYGETGTGKELIARAIHDRSARRERPLVKVNCGAISSGLVESELFGHVKGAFTGAIENRSGRFELADGGTLFLDEVGELPFETQVKLLRVLQEQEFEPVGSSRTVRVDVRIIAATNRDLAQLAASGHFRSDLFYRLNVFPLTVPPLRERRSDIPLLVTFFLASFSRKIAKRMESVSQEAMNLLMNYSWPGNIRELQNVIQRAVVLSNGPILTRQDLFPALGTLQPSPSGASAGAPAAPAGVVPPALAGREVPAAASSTLEDVERRHILDVLEETNWLIEGPRGAARILNLHPNTLRSRMKKLGIRRSTREKPQTAV